MKFYHLNEWIKKKIMQRYNYRRIIYQVCTYKSMTWLKLKLPLMLPRNLIGVSSCLVCVAHE